LLIIVSRGVLAGSKKDFQDLNAFLEQNKIKLRPLIDRVFPFEESPEAFKYLAEGKHVGKVVIRL
jgi:threonine dehydrogenase-like Zn-dependent dehydrogenase